MSIQRPSAYRRYSTTDTRETAKSDKITRINDLLDGIIGEQINGNEFNKLTYLSDIKRIIADALLEKGQTVEPSDAFMEYAEKILAIEGQQPGPDGYTTSLTCGVVLDGSKTMRVKLTEVAS